MASGKLETRTLMNEIQDMQKGWLYDFGHPLINRIAESFVKAAGGDSGGHTRGLLHRCRMAGWECGMLPDACVKRGKLSDLKGLAAGVYSGLTYGLREATGSHDWKNSAVAGAITGAALALTTSDPSHEQIVQCAVTGAALSTAANVLSGIF